MYTTCFSLSLSPLSLNDYKTGIWASQNIDSTYLDFIIS